jgi:predicted nucleic acid-binding protein
VGLTVADAGVVIAALDRSDAFHSHAISALRAGQHQSDRLTVPASAYAEALVGPWRQGEAATAIVDDFLAELPAEIASADREIARQAARLRAISGPPRLRLPDALVAATALVLEADLVLTTDQGWPATGLTVSVLTAS